MQGKADVAGQTGVSPDLRKGDMGPHWQYCTALPKDIIHSGPPGRDQGSGKSTPLKGGHALYFLIRANDCILQTGNQEKRHKHKVALSKLMQINTGEERVLVHSVFRRKPVNILCLTFTLLLWTPSFRSSSPSLSSVTFTVYSISRIRFSLCTVSTVLRPALHGVRLITMLCLGR